jgi:Flp pilus assembly pilin Flp
MFNDGKDMNKLITQLKRLIKDESGGEVMEYVMVAGLIVVVCIVMIAAFGDRVSARWSQMDDDMQ